MKILVLSYSLTGNNEALAASVASELAAEHIKITESKSRTTGAIFMDLIFNRTPQTAPAPDLDNYDLILFFGPVWAGQPASPLRAAFARIKTNPRRYGFISICGGAAGPNPKLAGELKKRTGAEPAILLDPHIADLLAGLSPTLKITSAYRLNKEDVRKLTGTVMEKVREII